MLTCAWRAGAWPGGRPSRLLRIDIDSTIVEVHVHGKIRLPNVPGRIVTTDGQRTLRLSTGWPWAHLMERILIRLRAPHSHM